MADKIKSESNTERNEKLSDNAGNKRHLYDDFSQIPEKKGKIKFSLGKTSSDNGTTNIQKTNSPTNIMKISAGMSKTNTAPMKMSIGLKTNVAPIKMSLASKKTNDIPLVKKVNHKIASVFNADEDSDEEEMPPEARMKMRNIGRETPTAAGPNSFGKGSGGFSDRRAHLKKELEKEWNKTVEEEDKVKELNQ